MNYLCISEDVQLGKDVRLAKFINLYGCAIGDNTKIDRYTPVESLFLRPAKNRYIY